MSESTLSALIGWNRAEAKRWHAWFSTHPDALNVSMGSGGGVSGAGVNIATVRKLILHTFAVDLRYGQRLVGLPVAAFENIEASTIDELFALAERGSELLAGWLAQATNADLDRIHTFMTLSAGELTATARKVLVHSCTHHVRHWAQIATVLRMNGHKSDWLHDFLLCDA
ncbi:MAG TPA: DinB family protein, partial [Planctomycetota bacterium]|nr:DinB family protein [Planctomycetota bacterium]